MKKVLTAATALLFGASVAMAQTAVTAAPSPTPPTTATPGAATVEEVVVQSQELDISREAIGPSLGATRYTVGPDRPNSQAQVKDAPVTPHIFGFHLRPHACMV